MIYPQILTSLSGKKITTKQQWKKHRSDDIYTLFQNFVHNGEATTLVDTDDDQNTLTFEIDRFSIFALTYTDDELAEVKVQKLEQNEGSFKAVLNAAD